MIRVGPTVARWRAARRANQRRAKTAGTLTPQSLVFGVLISTSLVMSSCAAPIVNDVPVATPEFIPTVVAEAVPQEQPPIESLTLDLERGGAELFPVISVPTAQPVEVAAASPTQRTAIVVHVVAEGETISDIAERYGVNVQTISSANGLQNEDSLAVGQELRILPLSGILHKVQEGDTLEAIAALYGVAVINIIVANGLDSPDNLRFEQELIIPGGTAPSRGMLASRSGDRPTVLKPGSYVVQPGDSLVSIAERYGITVETLLWANNVSDPNSIQPGDELVVLPVSGVLYTVKPGDTLLGVAEKHGVSLDEIMMGNGINDPTTIQVGDKLLLPGATQASVPTPTPPKPTATPQPKPPTATPVPSVKVAAVATATPKAAAPVEVKPTAKPATPPPAPTATPKPAAPAPAASGDLGSRISAIAQEYIGRPYVWGAVGPNSFDCTGFVWYIFNKRLGIPMPRDLWGQLGSGSKVSRGQVQAGDLVFFQNTYQSGLSHVGIAINNTYFVHAASERYGVMVSNLNDAYWAPRYYAASRPY